MNFQPNQLSGKKSPFFLISGGLKPPGEAKQTFLTGRNGSHPSQPWSVAIVDRFSGPENFVDLNGDRIPELSHGEVIQTILSRHLPKERIICVDIGERGTVSALNEVAYRVEVLGEPIGFVNFSQQTFGTTLEGLRDLTGIPELNANTLGVHREVIRDCLYQLYYGLSGANQPYLAEHYACHWPVIEVLDRLSVLGVRVFVSAGNEGPQQVNLFTLADQVVTVGAKRQGHWPLTREAIPESYSAVNDLVSVYAQGTFPVKEVRDREKRLLGLNITGGDHVDVPLAQVYNPMIQQELRRYRLSDAYQSPPEGYYLWGTSFALPKYLGELLARVQASTGNHFSPQRPGKRATASV